jgi:DNA-binding LacI/PurR family transcriptional regulator
MLAAEELGYHVNHLARSLIRQESGIICLVVADIDAPYRAALVKALTRELQQHGKIAMLLNTDNSPQSVAKALRQSISYRADASIILSGTPSKSIVDMCLSQNQKLVLINRDEHDQGPLRINLNETSAAERAVAAFKRAGCKQLTFANSMAMTPSLLAREAGFKAACELQGLSITIERYGATSYQSGAHLAQRILTAPNRPDGVFCATDLIALGFMDTARQSFGLNIPDDLCLMGFDDIEQAGWGAYQLTTFAQPINEIAARAVKWLSSALVSDGESATITLDPELIWRSTMRAASLS